MAKEEVTVVNSRAQQLFKLLVEQYIANGTPVPSKTLARLFMFIDIAKNSLGIRLLL